MSDRYPGGFITDGAPAGFSAFFDGSGDYLTYSPGAGVAFGTGDFTIEFWIYPTASISQVYLMDARNSSQTSSWAIGFNLNNTGAGQFTFFNGVAAAAYNESSQSCVLNQWNHCVVVRSGTTFSMFTNGTRVYTTTNSTNFSSSQTTSYIARGYATGSELYYTGYMSNIRIVKGTAVYDPAQTTLRVPTQLLNITNTSLLTCQSPTFIDNSSSALAITAFGDAKVSNFTPFAAYTGFNPALGAAAGGVWTLDQAAYYQNNRQWPIYDPYFNQTTLMLHGNGTNGAQNNTFLDSSSSPLTITRNGNTTQGTFSPFSQTGWSNYFNGSTDYFNLPFGAGTVGANDFSVEAWVYIPSYSSNWTIFSAQTDRATAGGSSWQLYIPSSTGDLYTDIYIGGTDYNFRSNVAVPLNTWTHVAMVRTGGTVSIFQNGVKTGTRTDFGTSTINTGSATYYPSIGSAGTTSPFSGYMSNFRLIAGSGVYNANQNFTPPTTALTAVTNTKILACQSNRFVDNSANNYVLTSVGTPSVQAFSPFVPAYITPTTYSNWFNGTNGYVSIASSANLTLGTGDFTIEAWVNPANWTNSRATIIRGGGVTNSPIFGKFDSSNNLGLAQEGVAWIISDATLPSTNTWTHVAVTRSGTTVKIFVNGVQSGSTATSSANFSAPLLTIAASDGSTANGFFTGAISNLRVLKGTALYTSAFTPPTAPLTAITNTSLLTCQSSTFVDNSASPLTLTASGTAYPVTSPTPFPAKVDTTTLNSAYSTSLIGGSAYFDGTGDYLTLPANAAFNFNSGDFTLETWLYMPNFSAFQEIFSQGSSNFQGIGIYITTAGKVNLDLGNGSSWFASLLSASSLKLNSWNHVAIVRQSTTYTIYLNGVADASTTSATYPSNASASSSYIGVYGPLTSQPFTGYMAGYRLVKGTAVYTSSFAPPVAPPTAVTNTALLCNFTNGAIFDNTAKNVFETVGNAQISTTQSKWGGSSMKFDGTNDYLVAYNNSQFKFGTGDFTIEMWIYPTYIGAYNNIFFTGDNSSSQANLRLNAGKVEFFANDSAAFTLTGATTLSINNWYHITFCRSGSSNKIFVNGIQDASATNSYSYTGSGLIQIASWSANGSSYRYAGYIDDLRVSRYARYTTNFTPPTSQLQDQ